MQRLRSFFWERLGLDVAAHLAAEKQVPVHRTSVFYFLGGMALFLFVIQVVTGILLSLYYKPSPDQAFESVRAIMTEDHFGWLIRSIHSWSANLLIGVLLSAPFDHLHDAGLSTAARNHMGDRASCCSASSWLSASAATCSLGISWHFSPPESARRSSAVFRWLARICCFWPAAATTSPATPWPGFIALHVVILPLIVFALLGIHLFLVQKHGMSIPEARLRQGGRREKIRTMPFVPHFLLRDMVGWYMALGLLAALAALFPWELGQKADPFGSAPPGIKPEWYFLFMFQALKKLPPHILGIEGELVGVLFFGFCGLIVLLVPFLDRGAEQGRPRRFLNLLAVFAVFGFIVMTAWGLIE